MDNHDEREEMRQNKGWSPSTGRVQPNSPASQPWVKQNQNPEGPISKWVSNNILYIVIAAAALLIWLAVTQDKPLSPLSPSEELLEQREDNPRNRGGW